MNIFFIEKTPGDCAISMVDRHVVKMILETGQLLATAHRVLDGQETVASVNGRKVRRWTLPDERDCLPKATHVNHPCAIWTRESNNNYNWLYCHFMSLLAEYTYRYGKKHKWDNLEYITYFSTPPKNIPIGYLTPLPCAMPKEYIISESIINNYRNYYKYGKTHLHHWTKREKPAWIDN